MTQIATINTIRQVPKKKWNALAGDNVFTSHSWLLTVEESLSKKVSPIYFLFQENGHISGAAVCYPVSVDLEIFTPDDLLFGRLKKFVSLLNISFLPALICGSVKSYGNHILLEKHTGQSEKDNIVSKILDAVESEARKQRLSVCFPRTLEQDATLNRQLHQRGYFQTLDLSRAYMDISWDSFDAYKKFIKNRSLNMKKNIAQEINKNRKSGVTIEKIEDFNGHEPVFYALLNDNNVKHNKTPLPFQTNFLKQLQKNFGKNLVIYRSLKKGQISGLGIMLKMKDTGSLAFVGIDHLLAKNDATFFNMLFYRPIADAINENIRRLYFGNAMYDMKIRRGCEIEKAIFFLKPRHLFFRPVIRFWFYLHQIWYQKKLPQSHDPAGKQK